jgi:hypothetical protein
MRKKYKIDILIMLSAILWLNTGCNGQSSANKKKSVPKSKNDTMQKSINEFEEGKNYAVFDRVRVMDNYGFTEPAEAFSLLLPKGWQQQGMISWTMPGQACAGNNLQFKAVSADGKYSFEILPNTTLSWTTHQQTLQWNLSNPTNSPYCFYNQPIDAEQYLQSGFIQEIGNPKIIKTTANPSVVAEMRILAEKGRRELMQYGASDVQIFPTALNAEVKWNDDTEGLVILSSTVIETLMYNQYDGSSTRNYTTSLTKKMLFKYPAGEKEKAVAQFAVIMSSIRTNPTYNDAVSNFWYQARQNSNKRHWEKIRLMDEQTRQMGEQAIAKGNQRLRDMDNEMRSWEAKQSSNDRIHTEFIKTIRGVENFRDESGKYEMTSGYNHVWSRGNGTSFVLSNDPNFDAATAFNDQQWKPMTKVD